MMHVRSVEYPSPWNWKISVDNFLESYHHRGVHPGTLDATFPGAQSFASDSGDEPWAGVDHVSAVDGFDPFVAIVAFPTLLVAVARGVGMTWFRLEPLTTDTSMLTIEFYVLPEFAEDVDFVQMFVDAGVEINAEDIWVNARTAAGLKSRFAQQGRISHLEAATWTFRKWLLDSARKN
jgi:phenylpropionate dioxygenase-like ring-hydroxylating dioxygenase large terminal subunit